MSIDILNSYALYKLYLIFIKRGMAYVVCRYRRSIDSQLGCRRVAPFGECDDRVIAFRVPDSVTDTDV